MDANWGWRVNAGPAEKALVFATGWFGRRLKKRAAAPLPADRPPPAGSWPDYGWYAEHSATLKRLWESATSEERARMRAITGTDHWAQPIENWRRDGQQLFRLMTLLCHWRESDRRRQRAGLSASPKPREPKNLMSAVRTIRRHLRPVRRLAEAAHTRIVELPHLLRRPPLGSSEWLIRSEVRYGGYVTNVARRHVSPRDTRTPEQLAFGGMTGGDRMLHHGYAPTYARYLQPFLGAKDLTVAEFGILKGTGLAIWCDLFASARVIGLDIDLSHFRENRPALERRGAFRHNQPELQEYDQLVSGQERLNQILNGKTLDIVIDDGLHSIELILTTWRAVEPFLSPRFAYLIEDFGGLLDAWAVRFLRYDRYAFGLLTVVSRGTIGRRDVIR